MRLVFAGTPQFAERTLAGLLNAGHTIALVLSRPDRPAGRRMRVAESPVKALAIRRGIDVLQPISLRDPACVSRVRAVTPDAIVVAAYGLLLPQAVLGVAKHGALNIHASLLPRWRGAAPIQRALLAGDTYTGISIMQMDSGLDTGPLLAQRTIAVMSDDDSETLHDRLAELGVETMIAVLADLDAGRAHCSPQAEIGVTYAPKIEKRELQLDWRRPAKDLERAVRAFRPAPGAFSVLRGEPLKFWRARVVVASGSPGAVLAAGPDALVIACGDGGLAVTELQRAGGRRVPIAAFLRGFAVTPGESFLLPQAAA